MTPYFDTSTGLDMKLEDMSAIRTCRLAACHSFFHLKSCEDGGLSLARFTRDPSKKTE